VSPVFETLSAAPSPFSASAVATNFVVAICSVFVPASAVGAVGVPVNTGESASTFDSSPVFISSFISAAKAV
jgi:hypothetical protein